MQISIIIFDNAINRINSSDYSLIRRPQSQAQITGRDITFSSFYEAPGQTLYWKMPKQFLGNKVTSYGGKLKYIFRYSGSGPLNMEPDVILRVCYPFIGFIFSII